MLECARGPGARGMCGDVVESDKQQIIDEEESENVASFLLDEIGAVLPGGPATPLLTMVA